jgi:glycosyltransferase involved in cell wall biosynthesis
VATFVFPDVFGGAERFIHGVARAQAASGHDVTVLAGDTGGFPAEERLEGFRLLRYPMAPVRGLRFFLDVRSRVAAALRELAAERFDIIHAHQIASAVPALNGSFPARRVLSFHAAHHLEFEAERLDGAPAGGHRALGLGDRLKSSAIGMLDRRCLRNAERIVVHTNFVLGQIEKLVPSVRGRVRIIPPGLDFARFAPGDRAAARRRLSIPQAGPLIVTVRRLVRRMGIDILIRAAGELASRGLQFVVAIGGAGVERKALEALRGELGLDEKVLFLGRVPDADLPELLRAADLIVIPSRSMEGFGISTIEGLACGTPVVATNTGASPEILEPIDPALLVPPEPGALAARMEELLRDSRRRSELSARGLESVRSRFAWPTIVASMDDVYGELVHAHARP